MVFKAVLLLILLSSSLVTAEVSDTLYLDIEKCVDMAVTVNWSVLKARLELEKSAASLLTAGSDLLPRVSLQSVHSKYEDSFLRQVGDRVVLTDKSYAAILSLRQSLRMSSVAQLLQAFAYKEVSWRSMQSIKQEIAYQARQKYLNVLKAKQVLGVKQEALEQSLKRLEKAKVLMDIGSGVRIDLLRAEVEVGSNRLAVISAQNALWLAESDLKHLLRVEQETPIVLSDRIDLPKIETTDEINLDAIFSRPDVLAAKASFKASRIGVWAERGGWFPAVSFGLANSYTGDRLPDDLKTLYDRAKWSWDFSVYFNLFDGLYTFSRVRSAKASREIARMDLDEAARSASLEARQAYQELKQSKERLEVSRKTVELAEEELRLAEESHNLGSISMIELIDAQVNLSQARESYIEALYDLLIADAKLAKATGRDLR